MVTFEQVSKTYGGRVVLAPLSLEIAKGTCLSVVGPSGSGKSTLLRIAIGLTPADAGCVRIDGTNVTAETVMPLRQRIGYVVQEGGLFPHLTARANAALMAEHLGWPEANVTERIRELAILVRLPEETLARYPAQLSGGQRQRVGLMRALMLDPPVLFLDEPMAALDPLVRARLQDDIHAIFARLGKTVLLVTHDMAEAAFLGDTIALMRDGALVQRGTIEELLDAPTSPFVTEFLHAHRALERRAEP